MRAVIQERYGPPERVLRLAEVERPPVAERQVLVRVRASCIHPDVWHAVSGRPWVLRLMGSGVRRPTQPIPGTEVAGVVEAVGPKATRFSPGDEVFGATALELQWRNGGAFAEYAAVPEDALALKPARVSFEQAAAVPNAGLIALHNLRGDRIRQGQNVLVNGAGGGLGTTAVQLAKAAGARVTGVDRAEKLEAIAALGADRVIDYEREDLTRGSERYDLVFDVASNLSPAAVEPVLAPGGVYLIIGHDHFGRAKGRVLGSVPRVIGLMLRSRFDRRLPRTDVPPPGMKEAMAELEGLLRRGALNPLVDRAFPLVRVADAMRRLAAGRACGRIVLTP